MDIARNERRLSFVTRSRADSSRTTDQSTLKAMSRLKSSSSSKSDREMVSSVQPVLAIASVERSERSKMAISPKQAPGFRTARASSPDPGMVREMRTSPSRMRNSRLPGSPSLNTCCPTANFCSRHTSATRASSPSSRSWKIAACLSRLRSTRRSYDARLGGASETVGDVGRSAYGASGSPGGGVSVRAPAGVAARDRRRGGGVGFLRRDAGAALRRLARGRRARPGRRQVVHGVGVPHGRALGRAASRRDRRGADAGHCRRPGVRRVVAAAAAARPAGSGGREGGDGAAAAHAGGVYHGVAAGAPRRVGDGGGRAVRDLGLRPRRGPGGRGGRTTMTRGLGMQRVQWAAVLLVLAAAAPLVAQEFHPPPVRRTNDGGTRLGLFGFGVRGGIDLAGKTQLVFGATLDAGNLGTNRFRLRPSAEIGVFNGWNSYAGSFEALYRFTGDEQVVTPYAGGGLSVAGHDSCGGDPQCPDLWANIVVGLELHYRSTFNWLLEYHAMDAFRHNRFYVGLTTRRGN